MQLRKGVRLGSRTTYAARIKVRVLEVLIAQELRLKVQAATSTSLYTARRLRAGKGKGAKGT